MDGEDGAQPALTLPTSREEVHRKGVTRYYDYKGRLSRKYITFEVGLQRYRGFYEDTADDELVITDGESEAEDRVLPQRDDLEKTERYGNVFFTPMSCIAYDLRKKASWMWSPVIGLGISEVTLMGEHSLIPKTDLSTFGSDEFFRSGRFETYMISGGALGSVQGQFWRGYGVMVFGRGAQKGFLVYEDGSRRAWHNVGRLGMRFGMDYRFQDYTAGFYFQLDKSELKLVDSMVESEVGTIVFSLTKSFFPFDPQGDQHRYSGVVF